MKAAVYHRPTNRSALSKFKSTTRRIAKSWSAPRPPGSVIATCTSLMACGNGRRPQRLGHEAAGVVEKVGAAVSPVQAR